MGYLGSQPATNFETVKKDRYTSITGTGITLSHSVSSVQDIIVWVNSVKQDYTSYSVNGTALTLGGSLVSSDITEVAYIGRTFQTVNPADATVTTAKLADSAVTAAKITDATITSAKLASGVVQNQSAFKNLIINGDMSIAQRATSVTGVGNGDNSCHTVDRFSFYEEGATSGEFTMSQDTDVPTGYGFAKSIKLDCTTADSSLAAAEVVALEYKWEGQHLQHLKKGTSNAESLTLSFWVKTNKTGTYVVTWYDNDNDRHTSQNYTVSSSNTWEKKTITFAADTSGALTNDNTLALAMYFILGAGTNYTSGSAATAWETFTGNADNWCGGQNVNVLDHTDNNFWITGVQLEIGTSATDFEFLPHDVNLRRCERYYQKSFNYSTVPADDTNSEFIYQYVEPYSSGNMSGLRTHYNTVMRAKPTVTLYTTAQGSGQGTGKISFYNGSSWGTASASVQAASSHKFHHLEGSSFSSMKLAQYNFEATAEL